MDLDTLDFPEFKPKTILKTYGKSLKLAPRNSAPRILRDVELPLVKKVELPTQQVEELTTKRGDEFTTKQVDQPTTKQEEELTTKKAVNFLLAGTLTSKVCKYCLSVTEVLFELHRIMEIATKGGLYSVSIKDMIASFHPFKEADDPNLPNKICEKCLDRTINSYLFTQQCEQTQRALLNCFDDINTKFLKLDPLEYVHRRGRRKTNPNHNKIEAEHANVIDYADPVIHIINTSSEALSTEPVISPLECLKCCQVLPNIQSLVSHTKAHPKTMWFYCRLCAKSFPKLYLLKRHYREHQQSDNVSTVTEEKLFECKLCSVTNRNHRKHLQHLEKHRFKTVLEHVLYKKMDDLCAVCLDKGNLVPLNKIVSILGGPPDSMGDTTMLRILDSTLPELHKNDRHQYTGSKICENCENNAITSYNFMKNAYFARDRLNTCVRRMLDNLEAIDPKNNLIIEIANDTIMPSEDIDDDVKENEFDDDDFKKAVFLEDEYRVKSEDEIEPETDEKPLKLHDVKMQNAPSINKEETDEVHMNGYQLDVREFLTFNKKQKVQKVNRRFTCPTCDKHFLSDYFVKKHILKHVSNKVICKPCGTEFGNKFSLNEHTKYAHELFYSDYRTCKVCGRGFAKTDKLLTHEEQHNNKTCMLCGKVFKTQRFFDIHMKRHIPKLVAWTKKHGQSCSFCEKECSNDNQLSLHVNKVHLQIKPYNCDMCEQKFYTEYNLRFHKKIHSKFRKEKCNFCNKIVKSRNQLVIHIRKHIGVTPHTCQLCKQAFYSQTKLKKHMNSTHGGSYLCKICKNVSVSKNELKAHASKAHSLL